MKAKFFFLTVFATVDAYFAGFALGFNSRHALIADPSIKPPQVEKKLDVTAKPLPASPAKTDSGSAKGASDVGGGKEAAPLKPDKPKQSSGAKSKSAGGSSKKPASKSNKRESKKAPAKSAGKT